MARACPESSVPAVGSDFPAFQIQVERTHARCHEVFGASCLASHLLKNSEAARPARDPPLLGNFVVGLRICSCIFKRAGFFPNTNLLCPPRQILRLPPSPGGAIFGLRFFAWSPR